jgi:hypothetical protein
MSDPVFFDANCMVGELTAPNPSGRPLTVNALQDELAYFGIADALVCHAEAAERNLHLGNARLVEEINGVAGLHPSWVIPMHTSIDYAAPGEYVSNMLELGIHAVRVWPPPYHGYLVDTWALGPLWDELADRRIPVLVGTSDLGRFPDQPAAGFSAKNLYEICQRYPSLPVVVVRLNFSALSVAVPLLRECPNLLVELSYFTTHRGVEYLVEQVGAERLVFGSGLPWASPGPGIAAVQYAMIHDEERQLIAGENLRRLLAYVGAGVGGAA